jgi:hypothetical protein
MPVGCLGTLRGVFEGRITYNPLAARRNGPRRGDIMRKDEPTIENILKFSTAAADEAQRLAERCPIIALL